MTSAVETLISQITASDIALIFHMIQIIGVGALSFFASTIAGFPIGNGGLDTKIANAFFNATIAICSLLWFIMSYYIANDAINLFNQLNSSVFVNSSEPWGAIAIVRNFSILAAFTLFFFTSFSFLPAV
jgi:hypothetical protein